MYEAETAQISKLQLWTVGQKSVHQTFKRWFFWRYYTISVFFSILKNCLRYKSGPYLMQSVIASILKAKQVQKMVKTFPSLYLY